MRVEIYSDIICPWCYIGKRRFERALEAFPGARDVEVVYRPYQLDPNEPETPRPLMDRLGRKFGAAAESMVQRVTQAGLTEGVEMNFDRALATNTLTAHRLLWLAEREYGAETQLALAEKLFEAHFTNGGDIGNHDALTAMAVAAGLDRGRVTRFLSSTEGVAEVKAEIDAARAMGITAVPTFIFDGRYAVQGGQPAPIFLQALETAARDHAATPKEA
jgi:predicted DsbA family dithiol-disulfide isomerase